MRSHNRIDPSELESALATIARHGGGTLRWFVCESTVEDRSLAAAHRLRQDAPLLHLRCTLPLDARHHLPDGFTTRSFRPGRDDAEWLEVNGRAFANHPEQGDWTTEVLRERLAEPWFDPQGFLLHEIDGRIAGFCWTKIHAAGYEHGERADDAVAPVGEIYVIGVDPAHHGKGLGRALTIAGFEYLAARGLQRGMLYVAGDNAAAIGLYESLGMHVAHHDDVFVGSVDPAPPR